MNEALIATVSNIFTALGTVGACILSLYFAFERNQHKLDCVFIWGAPNNYKPTLLINNLCSRTIILDKITITYDRKAIAVFDFFKEYKMREHAIVPAGAEKVLLLNAGEFRFPNLIKNDKPAKHGRKSLKIIVHTTSGKKFVSKYKYTYAEIWELIMGYVILGA